MVVKFIYVLFCTTANKVGSLGGNLMSHVLSVTQWSFKNENFFSIFIFISYNVLWK